METALLIEVGKLILGAYFEQMRIAGLSKEQVRAHFNEVHAAYLALDPNTIPDPK